MATPISKQRTISVEELFEWGLAYVKSLDNLEDVHLGISDTAWCVEWRRESKQARTAPLKDAIIYSLAAASDGKDDGWKIVFIGTVADCSKVERSFKPRKKSHAREVSNVHR